MTPTMTDRTNRTANSTRACSGIIASITKDSSPEDAIIMATRAPKLNILWVYRDTVAKPPIQPGIDPRIAAMTTWPTFVFRRPLKKSPLDSMLIDSIIIIITVTSPVISIELRSMSMNKCVMFIYVLDYHVTTFLAMTFYVSSRAEPDVRIYSSQPAMNRLTIGRRGELVVRVTIAKVSPKGMSLVSRCTLNVTVSPGAAAGIELCE